ADQTQIGNFSAFFVISVVKNQGTFGIPGCAAGDLTTLCNRAIILRSPRANTRSGVPGAQRQAQIGMRIK
ncbi:MAG: hypothetical protein WAV53_08155, partial [Anaerolineae bacterium]